MVHYKHTKLPWAIQPINIILNNQQEQYHIVCHMSGIVFINYACRKSEFHTFTHSKHHKRLSRRNLEYHSLIRLHIFNITFFMSWFCIHGDQQSIHYFIYF